MLDYATYGAADRPPLTLLHAGGLTRREWDPFLPNWSRHFHLITATALGHGDSPKVESLSFQAMSASVIELLDHLGISRTHLLGSSMGGVTALTLALDHPERIDRLVLYRAGFRTRPEMKRVLNKMVDPETWRHWGMESLMRRQHQGQGGAEAWVAVAQRVIDLIDPAATDDLVAPADLARIESPTLLIAGDRDPLVPLEDLLVMFGKIPKCALWLVPDGSHVLGMEGARQAAFESEVNHFLLQKTTPERLA